MILSIIAIILLVFVFIINYLFNFVYGVKNKKWYKLMYERNKKLGKNIDIMANFIFIDLWNSLLSRGGYSFGKLGETLSSVFGKKINDGSLSFVGYFVAITINVVDFTTWFKGGHCKYAIQTEEEIIKFYKNE